MRKETYYGIISGLLLLLLYGGITFVFNGPSHVAEQIREYGFLILLLAAGFATQMGLFFYGRTELANRVSSAQMAATGGTSAGTMIACCLHHVTDILPFLGLSGVFLFFSEYQSFFMVLGIVSSVVGITLMLSLLQRHRVFPFPFAEGWPWAEIRNTVAVLGAIGITALAAFTWFLPQTLAVGSPDAVLLSTQTSSQNGVEVKATPILSNSHIAFKIAFDTHQTELDFSVQKIAYVMDERGKKYFPVSWDGSALGGHHRSGILRFDSIPSKMAIVTLVLQNVGGVDRIFRWEMDSSV